MGESKIPMQVVRCTHHGYVAVTIGGMRVTPKKCCGTWNFVVANWNVDADDIERATAEAVEEYSTPTEPKP